MSENVKTISHWLSGSAAEEQTVEGTTASVDVALPVYGLNPSTPDLHFDEVGACADARKPFLIPNAGNVMMQR